jgi:hypothetical protein
MPALVVHQAIKLMIGDPYPIPLNDARTVFAALPSRCFDWMTSFGRLFLPLSSYCIGTP